ncbi:MAG: elongation factor 1-beta [Candidatus Aenigmarchaeota archaeon]|nr:elongation factor 1-beta [Candidatus Aenigmarchaeota archaeon]
MTDVIVTFKIMPTGVDVNLDKLEKDVVREIKPQRTEREPIAFGLIAVNVTVLVPDEEGQLEKVENKLRELEGVEGVEVTEITRSI